MSKKSKKDILKEQITSIFEGAWTIPNLLSTIRILLVPLFLVLFNKEMYVAGYVTIFASALTDFYDGYIARKFNQFSKLGTILDPIADKLTTIALTITLYFYFHAADNIFLNICGYLLITLCVVELVMIIGSFILLSMGVRPVASDKYGKYSTFYFYCVIGLILLHAPTIGVLSKFIVYPGVVFFVLLVISVILKIRSFISYIPPMKERFAEMKAAEEEGDTD
ncbi:MAG: CDP-alcohol phosphatidyltransferase family protein [Ruminococcaceae bacterium]|nr:CDP-alcohol phosphatidyltransferase family protein [Oscillospiraceae bacterium]